MILNLAEWSRKAAISYSGTYTSQKITANGRSYILYSLTGSGTLTVKGAARGVDIWACGGGGSPKLVGGSAGGGGGYTAQSDNQTLRAGQYVVSIGAAQAATSITRDGTAILTADGAPVLSGASDANRGKGGSGGGTTGGWNGIQTGQGTTTRPFNDSVNFPSLPCAGGGGAGGHSSDGICAKGGAGGSNGSNGGLGDTSYSTSNKPTGGAGGATGGGKGSSLPENGASYSASYPGTYYGSGGGGARGTTANGVGYQGWMLLRVPIDSISTQFMYYRLNMSAMKRASTSGTFFSVAELKLFYGDDAISTAGATFSASSSLSGYPVSQAFDGNASTLWHVDGSPSSAWIQVQLPATAAITSFSITPRGDQNDRLDAFTLDASNDGSTWTTLYSAANQASGWTQGATKTFTI